jgi:2-polyprenyl-6-methoxyphenol hydroxylase-like FAD-dependent oxidoreductase
MPRRIASSVAPFDTDVLIIGAGPSGLALARALADAKIRSIVLDAQDAATLADPPPDGRDIALTHRAQTLMRGLGLWEVLPADELAPLREAVVYNGSDPRPLRFDARGSGEDELGHLVEPNQAMAQECFHTGHTLAVLAMNSGESSIVVTVSSDVAAAMQRWDDEAFTAWVQRRLGGRLGTMTLRGARHLYPLVAVYAPRFALIGDAAVGMHPVTAHGYNLGLYGVEVLGELLAGAQRAGRDLGSLALLQPHETRHRREIWPVYHGTNAEVGLFTDDSETARWMREAVIRVADRLPLLKSAITQKLTRRSAFTWPSLPKLPTLPLPGRCYQ